MNEVFAFLKECGAFFIITDNNGAPAGRPFNSMIADGNDLIIGVSNAKDIYRQLKANSRIQIVSLSSGNKWIRANGFALEEFDSFDLKERLYNEDKPCLLQLETAHRRQQRPSTANITQTDTRPKSRLI